MKKVHINMCPILDGYGVMGIFSFPYRPSCEPRLTEPAGGVMHSASLVADFSELQTVQLWAFFNSRTRLRVNHVLRNHLAGSCTQPA